MIDDLNRKINGATRGDGDGDRVGGGGRASDGLRRRSNNTTKDNKPSKRKVLNQTIKPSDIKVGVQQKTKTDRTSRQKEKGKAKEEAKSGALDQVRHSHGAANMQTEQTYVQALHFRHNYRGFSRVTPCRCTVHRPIYS